MRILFVSNSRNQTVVTVKLEGDFYNPNGFETHLYNHKGGHTEMWSRSSTFEEAAYMHKQLCEKCNIQVNM